jgi:hypothetical protein
MATGTVSSINQDNWQLIQTNTVTSGTSVSYSFSGYKKLMLTWNQVNNGVSAQLYFRLNANSGAVYSGGAWAVNTANTYANTTSLFYMASQVGLPHCGWLTIEDANLSVPKRINGVGESNGYLEKYEGSFLDTTAITSMTVTSGAAFTSGTISLYGIAA